MDIIIDAERAVEKPAGWWLVIDGKTSGPHTEAFIISTIGRDGIAPNTLACPAGDNRWRQLSEWPQFRDLCRGSSEKLKQLNSVSSGSENFSWWHREWPLMANLIGWYCLGVWPTLKLIGLVTDFAMGRFSIETDADWGYLLVLAYGQMFDIAVLVCFVVSGWQLLNNRPLARTLVPISLTISIAQFLALFAALVVTFPSLVMAPKTNNAEPTDAAMFALLGFLCFGILIGMSCFGFEVYAVRWWYDHSDRLVSSPSNAPTPEIRHE